MSHFGSFLENYSGGIKASAVVLSVHSFNKCVVYDKIMNSFKQKLHVDDKYLYTHTPTCVTAFSHTASSNSSEKLI